MPWGVRLFCCFQSERHRLLAYTLSRILVLAVVGYGAWFGYHLSQRVEATRAWLHTPEAMAHRSTLQRVALERETWEFFPLEPERLALAPNIWRVNFLTPSEIEFVEAAYAPHIFVKISWLGRLLGRTQRELPTLFNKQRYHVVLHRILQDIKAIVAHHVLPLTAATDAAEDHLQLAAYDAGDSFGLHTDNTDVRGDQLVPVSAMIYLKAPDVGGHTVFPFAQPHAVSIPPQPGDLIIWGNCNDTSGQVPDWARHAGEVIITGEKIILNRFFHQHEIPLSACHDLSFRFPASRPSALID
jgi:hypothetical protein